MIDNLAYCEWGNITIPQELRKAASETRYDKVFLLEPIKTYENDAVRREGREDQQRLHTLIKKAYQRTGHQVIEVPPHSIENRVDYILAKL